MRVAHLADAHLGFRQFQRLDADGLNQREADVAAAFRRAIDAVIARAPDAVVIAGDLFHAVRPTNRSIIEAFTQLSRLRQILPAAPVILIAGNHDSPVRMDACGQLADLAGVRVVGRPRSAKAGGVLEIETPNGHAVVAALPFAAPGVFVSALELAEDSKFSTRPALSTSFPPGRMPGSTAGKMPAATSATSRTTPASLMSSRFA